MSIRRYCDRCGTEISRSATTHRIRRQLDGIQIEVMVGWQGTWNAGDVCRPCTVLVIQAGQPFGGDTDEPALIDGSESG